MFDHLVRVHVVGLIKRKLWHLRKNDEENINKIYHFPSLNTFLSQKGEKWEYRNKLSLY